MTSEKDMATPLPSFNNLLDTKLPSFAELVSPIGGRQVIKSVLSGLEVSPFLINGKGCQFDSDYISKVTLSFSPALKDPLVEFNSNIKLVKKIKKSASNHSINSLQAPTSAVASSASPTSTGATDAPTRRRKRVLKKVACPYEGCNSVVYQGNINVHMRLHTGKMPHQCTYCNKAFMWRTSALNHQEKCTHKAPPSYP